MYLHSFPHHWVAQRSDPFDFYLDPSMMDASRAEHVKKLLQNALKTLEKSRRA